MKWWRMASLRAVLTVLSASTPEEHRASEVEAARRALDEALEALRAARAGWESPQTIDIAAVRRALDAAERQLDAARVRLQRALAERDRDPKG